MLYWSFAVQPSDAVVGNAPIVRLRLLRRKRKDEVVVEMKPTTLPKSLEIRPDDSQEAIEKKKRKLNMFRRQEKKQKEEQQSDTR